MNIAWDTELEEELARAVPDPYRPQQRKIIHQMRELASWAIPEASEHGARAATLAAGLAAYLGWTAEDQEAVYYAASVHDIGKVLVDREILMKGTHLVENEYHLVQKHPQAGHDMFIHLEGELYQACAQVTLYHHERWDGQGYPKKLKSTNIPRFARLVSVVDVYDCICNDRPYRRAIQEGDALAELRDCSGAQFDPEIVEGFCQWRR